VSTRLPWRRRRRDRAGAARLRAPDNGPEPAMARGNRLVTAAPGRRRRVDDGACSTAVADAGAAERIAAGVYRDCVETAGGVAPGGRYVVAGVGVTHEDVAPGRPGDPAGRLKSGEDGPGPPGGLTPGPVPVCA
jgi:hypothetical protein